MGQPKHAKHPGRRLAFKIIAEEGGSVLDAGCCMGRDYPYFVKRGLKYTGFDITPKFIKEFKRKHPNADARVASVLDIPFEDETFTSVYSGGVVQHLHPDEYPLAIKEMWRVITSLMVLVIPPFEDKETINLYRKRFYRNRFTKETFLGNINALNGVGVVELKENIKPNEQGSMTLIIVRKEIVETETLEHN